MSGPRAKRRDWTLGALDRGRPWLLIWDHHESRWAVHIVDVVEEREDGVTVLAFEYPPETPPAVVHPFSRPPRQGSA